MKLVSFIIRTVVLFIAILLLLSAKTTWDDKRIEPLDPLPQVAVTPVSTTVATVVLATATVAKPQGAAAVETKAIRTPDPAIPTDWLPDLSAMEVIQSGQAVDGYAFSQARPIPGTIKRTNQVIGWLPNSSDELLIIRESKHLEVINVNTGQAQLYGSSTSLIESAVWLPARQSTAYLSDDPQDYTTQYVWLNDGKKTEKIFTTSWLSPLAVTPDGHGVIVFDANWQLTQIGSLEPEKVKLATDTQMYAPPNYNHDELYKVSQAPNLRQAVYFNQKRLLLTDFTTGSISPIDLEAFRSEDRPSIDHVRGAVWNRKSDKIVLLTAPAFNAYGSNLFIWELKTNKLNFIHTPFRNIMAVDWAKGDQFLMFSAGLDSWEGYGLVHGLFMVNISSGVIKRIASVPGDAWGNMPTWSPDGRRLTILYTDKPRSPGLYIIDVTLPE